MSDKRNEQIETLKQALGRGDISLDAYTEAITRLTPSAYSSDATAIGDNTVAVAERGVMARDVSGSIDNRFTLNIHSPLPGASKDELRRAYLMRLSLQANQLPLFAGDSAASQIKLASIYTALLTQTSDTKVGNTVPSEMEEGKDAGTDDHRLSALEVLNRETRLVLLGGPGSGKSTFASFIALSMAGALLGNSSVALGALRPSASSKGDSRNRTARPQVWSHGALLPVQIVLRDFAAELSASSTSVGANTLWQHITSRLEQATLGDFAPHLHEELMQRGGIILLDGLDEVPDAANRRTLVKQAVQDFSNTFGRCRFLVTSRTYAYTRQDWKLVGFAEARLRPFSSQQIERFVDSWYTHMVGLNRLSLGDAKGRAEVLKRTIRNRERIRELAEQPLLLTLIVRLQTEGGGALPEKREDLYAQAVEMLLTQWESLKTRHRPDGTREAEPGMAEFLKTGRNEIRRELDKLAFEAHRDQVDLAGTADIGQDRLVRALIDAAPSTDVNPRLIEHYLRDRAGILAAHGNGLYQFPHRTFQEYLAACHLTTYQYPDELTKLALVDPNRWREVTLLAAAKAGRGTPESVWSLVEALCPFVEPPINNAMPVQSDLWGAFLASQSLFENGLAGPSLSLAPRNEIKRKRVQRWSHAILQQGWLGAADRSLVGRALSALGDDRDFDEVMHIPPGEFWMGDSADRETGPRHVQTLPAFEIGKYLVTNAQYARFVQATSRRWTSEEAKMSDRRNHPARWVSWSDAIAYCDWLTEVWRQGGKIESGAQVTLPSEAEWEKAARFTDGRTFPWGMGPGPDRANTSNTGIGETSAVGLFPDGASQYGCLDMIGNLWEWTRSKAGAYPYVADDRREDIKIGFTDLVMLRGGCYANDVESVGCATRKSYLPTAIVGIIGFRIVVIPSVALVGDPL